MSIQQEKYVTEKTPTESQDLSKIWEALSQTKKDLEKFNEIVKQVAISNEGGTESHQLSEIFHALSKAQLEMPMAELDSINPFFHSKYADLSSLMRAARPFLSKNGICVTQRIKQRKDGMSVLSTRMGHSSGQWMESIMLINPPKQDIQSLGSYLTYLRRYSYAAMVGVVAGDEDDDGERVMDASRTPTDTQREAISKAQLNILAEELKGEEGILENMLRAFAIPKLSDLPQTRYTKCIERIREIKRNREGDK